MENTPNRWRSSTSPTRTNDQRSFVCKPRVRVRQVLASLSLLFVFVCSSGFRGVVVSVTDGDTIKVKHGDAVEVIRLDGIDAPEKKQEYGAEAKEALSGLILNKEVEISPVTKDRYGRTVAKVDYNGSVNEFLVQSGNAWWFRKYARKNTKLALLEADARLNKRGLWAEAGAVAPWEFRKQNKTAPETKSSADQITGLASLLRIVERRGAI